MGNAYTWVSMSAVKVLSHNVSVAPRMLGIRLVGEGLLTVTCKVLDMFKTLRAPQVLARSLTSVRAQPQDQRVHFQYQQEIKL